MNQDKFRILLLFSATILFFIGIFFSFKNKVNTNYNEKDIENFLSSLISKNEEIDKKTKNEKNKLNSFSEKSQTSEKDFLSSSETSYSSAAMLADIKNVRHEETSKGKTIKEILDEINNLYGIKFINKMPYNKKINFQIKSHKSVTEIINDLAIILNLAIIGDINKIEGGFNPDVFLTDSIIYIGENQNIISSLESIFSEDNDEKINGIKKIAESKDADSTSILINTFLLSTNEPVNNAALDAIKATLNEQGVDTLISFLSDSAEEKREKSKTLLGEIGGEMIINKLNQEKDRTTDPDKMAAIDDILIHLTQPNQPVKQQ